MEKQDVLPFVLQVSRRMVEIRDLHRLLAYALDQALLLVGAERGYIVLRRPDETLDFRVRRDNEGNDLPQRQDHISQSVLNVVVEEGKSLVVRDALTDKRFSQAKSVLHLRLRSIMCVPLLSEQDVIGAIYVENRSVEGRFGADDIAPLEIFANQAAVAIENAQLNENLARANEDLRRLDDLKSRFIIVVSHELRTPLAVIKGYTDIIKMKSSQSNPALLTYVHRLEQSVGRMNTLIQEIISVFRMASDQLSLQAGPVLTGQLIEDIVKIGYENYTKRNLKMSVTGLDTLPTVIGDGVLLRTAITNVIGNAIKFTPDGRSIEVRGEIYPDEIAIVVADQGIGIPKEEQERIFDLFHVLAKLENHSTSKYEFGGGGMGLGLPIAKGIVEAHGGRIVIESDGYDPEQLPGTTCTIYLPRRSLNAHS